MSKYQRSRLGHEELQLINTLQFIKQRALDLKLMKTAGRIGKALKSAKKAV